MFLVILKCFKHISDLNLLSKLGDRSYSHLIIGRDIDSLILVYILYILDISSGVLRLRNCSVLIGVCKTNSLSLKLFIIMEIYVMPSLIDVASTYFSCELCNCDCVSVMSEQCQRIINALYFAQLIKKLVYSPIS